METTTRYTLTRGFGDLLAHISLSRGASWTTDPARAITFATRDAARACARFYALDGVQVIPCV